MTAVLAVLRLLIVRSTPADANTIAVELELPQATAITALSDLREAGFVQQFQRAGRYGIADNVLEQLVEASRRDLRLPPRPREMSPLELALMDAEQHRRYCAEIETALVKACKEQIRVVLPSFRELATHFGLTVEWAAAMSTLLAEQVDAKFPEHMPLRARSSR